MSDKPDLRERIERLRLLKDKSTEGSWLEKARDSSTFEFAIIAEGLPLLADCEAEIERLSKCCERAETLLAAARHLCQEPYSKQIFTKEALGRRIAEYFKEPK